MALSQYTPPGRRGFQDTFGPFGVPIPSVPPNILFMLITLITSRAVKSRVRKLTQIWLPTKHTEAASPPPHVSLAMMYTQIMSVGVSCIDVGVHFHVCMALEGSIDTHTV